MPRASRSYRSHPSALALLLSAVFALTAGAAFAQEGDEIDDAVIDEEDPIEEVVVTGTQIRGASISEALPVSVLRREDIEVLGIDSGDELLDYLPEQGQNYFSEAENISGGVNSARGDVGAFNLRSLGTGNTLVLLNGRRMVNAASYQTEEVGGSFVPVNTVNSNTIPVFGIDRIEVLREGASALYGADAVAGVVNTVLRRDFEGFTARLKWSEYDGLPRDDQNLTLEFGKFFNGGRTNVSMFANYYTRDRVNSQDDPRWADSDLRSRVRADSPWAGDTAFRNDSANSLYGQFDVRASASSTGLRDAGITDSSGEFETYPLGDPRCEGGFQINEFICGHPDGQGTFRYNLNENRDLVSDLERGTLFVFLNHEFENGVQSFTEFGYYESDTNLNRHPSASFSTVKLRVGAQNYYNPFGPCGSPNRLPDEIIGTDVPCEGLELEIDNYRFAELPRVVDNDKQTWRFLQGFRGAWGEWDWETAFVWSEAESDDVTHNRVSNILMQEALNDPTPAAYNPFSGGVNSNIERALIDVTRRNKTDLKMVDFKVSTPTLYDLPGGPLGALVGVEYREESFVDDRDTRLDGTIVFTDAQGDTFPFVSDVVNSSPTPDSRGERDVTSLFGELQIPVLDNLDVQLALRYEDFSDVGQTTVGKVAAGWRVHERVLLRGSWSEAFRAPNLVTINEEIVARQNTRTDWACMYAADNGGDPEQDTLDCVNSTQRIAQGSQNLRPEESNNTSVGIVVDPIDDLTLTFDYWTIEKKDTIGLFGEENHTILDLLNRLNHGPDNCGALEANPAVSREVTVDPDEAAIYQAAGICPAGLIQFIDDRYINLDKRTVKGFDVGVYYDVATRYGDFHFNYLGAFLDEYEQEPGGLAQVLVDAQNSGQIPSNYPIAGFADLIRMDGNPRNKQSAALAWRKGRFGASIKGLRIGSIYQNDLTLADGTRYNIPSVTTFNTTFDYSFDIGDSDARVRLGVNNLTDKRAPLADRFFGYFADVHRDIGRSYYLEVRFSL